MKFLRDRSIKNKIVILQRAEKNSGKIEIGKHISRLGYAESEDGI